MFARVSHVRYPSKQYDAGLRVIADLLMPALRRAPGYRGCCLLAGGKPGTGLGVVLWETEEAADAAAIDRAVTAAHVELAALGLVIEGRKIYEVVVRDTCSPERSRPGEKFPPP